MEIATTAAIFVLLMICGTEAMECYVPNQAKTRVFDSLVHYQANKIPFNPIKAKWQGSNVNFSCDTIPKLEKNSFISYDSESIIGLELSEKQITIIDSGAFISLTCLHHLNLSHNNITEVSRNVFQDLQKLNSLDLSHNQITMLTDYNFDYLIQLKDLHLENNQIKHIRNFAFVKLYNLEFLNLERNQILFFWYDVFGALINLGTLNLGWNKLNAIEPEKWDGLKKLQNLSLAGNDFDHFDLSYNFTFSSLGFLNLSYNSLSMLDVAEMKRHLPKLGSIDLNGNPWFCNDLQQILLDLQKVGTKAISANSSTISINGIECSEVTRFSPKTTTIGTTTTTKMNQISKEEIEKMISVKVKSNTETLKNAIASVKSLVYFVFALLCVFIVLELVFKTNIFQSLIRKLRGDNDVLDNSNVEHFSLLNR